MADPEPIVFVVDDDSAARSAVENILQSVGLRAIIFGSAAEFLEHPVVNAPCCLVLDVRLPGMSGLEFQRELAARKITIPIIFITGHGDIPMSVEAMKAGAMEFLTKPFRGQILLDAIHKAIDRDRASRQELAKVSDLRGRLDRLTPREREVLERVVAGLLNKQIAAELGTSERGSLMRKMGAESLPDLVRMAEKLDTLPTRRENAESLPKVLAGVYS
jgi:FixJ family two-component response regulator